MISHSGIKFTRYQGVPTLKDVCISAMRIPRWCGSTALFWPLGMHMEVMGDVAKAAGLGPRHELAYVVHDLDETLGYGDISSELKTRLIRRQQAEMRTRYIREAFDLDLDDIIDSPAIHAADKAAAAAERYLMIDGRMGPECTVDAIDALVACQSRTNYHAAEYIEANGRPVLGLVKRIYRLVNEVRRERELKEATGWVGGGSFRVNQNTVGVGDFYGPNAVFNLPDYPRGHVRDVLAGAAQRGVGDGLPVDAGGAAHCDPAAARNRVGRVAEGTTFLSTCAYCGVEHVTGKLHTCHPEG